MIFVLRDKKRLIEVIVPIDEDGLHSAISKKLYELVSICSILATIVTQTTSSWA